MRSLSLYLGLAVVLTAAGSALSYPTEVHVSRLPGYFSGVGGEFTLTVVEPVSESSETWQSFCMEYNEHINPNKRYDVVLNTAAVRGGNGSGSDPLDPRTAYLYSSFLDQTLGGYDYTPGAGRARSAAALQAVIWHLEGERPMSWGPGSKESNFYSAAQNCGWDDIGNVRVLNLYRGSGHKQDQLYRIPNPATIFILGAGFAFVAAPFRRGSVA